VALVAIAIAIGLAAVDALIGDHVVLITLLAFPPLLTATRSSPSATAAVAALCLALALGSIAWNGGIEPNEYPVRILVVVLGAGAAIWIATLRESLRREHAAADLLAETGLLLQESLDPQERADQIARIAVPDLADAATVDILDPSGEIVRMATASEDPEVVRDFTELRARVPVDPEGSHPVAVAIRTGEVQLIEGIGDKKLASFAGGDAERELMRRTNPSSVLAVPLRARGTMLGALSLWILDPTHRHDRRSQNVALRLAHRVALALDNTRLHDQQAHIANVLQSSLRPPSLPRIAGFEVAARFEAAGEAHLVGGDFYDAFVDDEGAWSVVIGDVCGKGPEAASLTALARYTVRGASRPDTPPSQVLRILHESIADGEGDLRFCTAALLRIDPSSGPGDHARVTVSLGGHPRPLVARADGSVHGIGETGTLLGILPSPSVTDAEATLAPGEALVLYTDGLLEARDRSEAEDPAWLAEKLASFNGADADEIAQTLAGAAIERQGGEPRDDIAVVVLRRRSG
jgi:serine phosphatase RsbU (regulator of sigma subunit)